MKGTIKNAGKTNPVESASPVAKKTIEDWKKSFEMAEIAAASSLNEPDRDVFTDAPIFQPEYVPESNGHTLSSEASDGVSADFTEKTPWKDKRGNENKKDERDVLDAGNPETADAMDDEKENSEKEKKTDGKALPGSATGKNPEAQKDDAPSKKKRPIRKLSPSEQRVKGKIESYLRKMESLVGMRGFVVAPVGETTPGLVSVFGAAYPAVCPPDERIPPGREIFVTKIMEEKGLLLVSPR